MRLYFLLRGGRKEGVGATFKYYFRRDSGPLLTGSDTCYGDCFVCVELEPLEARLSNCDSEHLQAPATAAKDSRGIEQEPSTTIPVAD